MQYKNRLRRIDGEFRWVDSRVEPLRDENGAIVRWYGVITDIDDEVKAQESLRLADERLLRASRAASLSELSVSIAHELNSPLQAVVANANAFQRWLNANPPNYERAGRTAERIIRDANAAADVIARIRSLFAQTEHGRAPTDLNGIINEVCELTADRLQSNNVRLELKLAADLPPVMADRAQVEQVVLNLVRNAIEAMHDTPPQRPAAPHHLAPERGDARGRGARPRARHPGPRPDLRCFLHHQGGRHGHGARHLPLHHRSP
jgi:signal transduction histidine kinase